MPETEAHGWMHYRMELLSLLNIVLAAVVIGAAFALGATGWAFWTAIVAGGHVIVLESFDEWAELHELDAWTVGPEAVTVLAGLWMVATMVLVGGSIALVTVMTVAGLVIAAAGTLNLVTSVKFEEPVRGARTR